MKHFAVLALALSLLSSVLHADDVIDFNRDIRPILSNNCFLCHGPDDKERKADLRLDTPEGAFADLGGYAAVVRNQPEKSELIQRITAKNPGEMMPPRKTGKSLKPLEIELLTKWVKQGAPYAKHWAFVKPVRPEPPAVKDKTWARNEVDRFILARLEREGLKPRAEADRSALIRRVALDLTGLPPTPKEVEAFLSDRNADAYEKMVDRLLAKPAYGEHWARLWLDLARYADSAGYADDPPRTIWGYRDYVIKALNANKPFDQFSIEQIAGDLLPNPGNEQLIATAFHRNTMTNSEGGTNDEEFRNVAIVDRVNTTTSTWMGLSMACAQCHNHKYDPISQEEYFRFFAFFNNTDDADRRDESPLLSFYSEELQRQRSQWEAEAVALKKQLTTPTPELLASLAKWDRDFPRDLRWSILKAAAAKATTTKLTVQDDLVLAAAGPNSDTFVIEFPVTTSKLSALRLEALPHESLPGKGPGHGPNGNFVVSHMNASLVPLDARGLAGRYVRVELPGKGKILSLAEVQVFAGADNVARRGQATQSSTAYDGPALLAIDGNTDGNFAVKSTTHTDTMENPWWEVDLKSTQSVDRIVLWNRTDGVVGSRLAGFRVILLDEKRTPVWNKSVMESPSPSVALGLSGLRDVPFVAALADATLAGFDPATVLNESEGRKKGWSGGGGKSYTLTLLLADAINITPGSKLVVNIEQAAKQPRHTLGSFRISTTDQAGVAVWAKTPANVLQALSVPDQQRDATQRQTVADYYLKNVAPELQSVRQQLALVEKQLADMKPVTVPIMREMPDGRRRKTSLQHRGNYLDLGPQVSEGVPAVLPSLPKEAPLNRLTLARWLVDENNPLTARVIVNRFWEQIFGIGIVRTSEEFGAQGEMPSHPEMLDWLATELVRQKWDMKAFLKLLVTSAAYRQSSRVTPELWERDPENRLLARGPRFRLAAEVVRDQALFVSGLLSEKMYGQPVRPPRPSMGLSAAFGGSTDWQTSAGEDKHRRALYTEWRRSNPYPSMLTFDAPNREVCTVRRNRTNTPLQALVTLNDPVYVEAAQALGRRMATSGKTSAEKASAGFKACLVRDPSEAEVLRLVELYEENHAEFARDRDKAQKLATMPLGPLPTGTDVVEAAAWTSVANVLLNLDEMFMKR